MRVEHGGEYGICPGDLFVVPDSGRHGNNKEILAQFVDRQGKALAKDHKVLLTMASYESMERRADLTRGVMTLPQSEMWHFVSTFGDYMRALRKAQVHFPKSSTAAQCIGPVDVLQVEDAWQLTVGAQKRIYGEEGKTKAGGPGPEGAAGSAADADDNEPKNKVRKTADTVEPVTWHGTAPAVWEEILNIAGANNPFPKLVVELVATDDIFGLPLFDKEYPIPGRMLQ